MPDSRSTLPLATTTLISSFKAVLSLQASYNLDLAAIAKLITNSEPSPARTLQRLLDDNIDHLAERLSQLDALDTKASDLDKETALSSARDVLNAVAFTRSDVSVFQIDGEKLPQRLRPIAEATWSDRKLTPLARECAWAYLMAAGSLLVNVASKLPDFTDQSLLADYSLTYKTHEVIDTAINSVALTR